VSLEGERINQVILSKKDGEEFVKFNALMTDNVKVLLSPLLSVPKMALLRRLQGMLTFLSAKSILTLILLMWRTW
jgi:hypothetical protein